MKKYKTLITFLIILAAVAILFSLGRLTNPKSTSKMILFFGDTCPHCKDVDEFITANKTRERLDFQELEVYNNAKNARLLTATAKTCGLNTTDGIGVPFFFDGENCLLGSEPIIDFLKTK